MMPRAKKTQWSWRVNPSQSKDLNFFTNVVKTVLKQCLQKMPNMSFCSLKNFLRIRSTCFKLSECSPRLGLSNALRFMVVRPVRAEIEAENDEKHTKFTLITLLTCASLFVGLTWFDMRWKTMIYRKIKKFSLEQMNVVIPRMHSGGGLKRFPPIYFNFNTI